MEHYDMNQAKGIEQHWEQHVSAETKIDLELALLLAARTLFDYNEDSLTLKLSNRSSLDCDQAATS